jgi:hypothetical protein
MQPGDVLVIGPLDPVLPRPLRVRLRVAVTCAASCVCAAVVLATFLLNQFGLVSIRAPEWLAGAVPFFNSSQPVVTEAPVQVSSVPAGARILQHNRDLGTTPASVNVGPGEELELSKPGYLDSVSARHRIWHGRAALAVRSSRSSSAAAAPRG